MTELLDFTVPIVIIGSHDGAEVPTVRGLAALEAYARDCGWRVQTTYALASMPDRPRKSAHLLGTVCMRVRRDGQHGFATWEKEDEQGWRFAHAWFMGERIGARQLKTRLMKG